MTTGIANSKTIDEAQIRALIDDRAKAVRDKNVNEAISSIAPDIVSFDVVNPFQQIGSDAFKKSAEDWFPHSRARSATSLGISASRRAIAWRSHMVSATLAQRGQTEDNAICGGARPFASAKLMRSGRSRMSITRSTLTWRAARRRWISSLRKEVRQESPCR
jgi:hypothetical protein